ncbi:hypothetical protein [Lacihabitans soyangensis]|uniref:Uncharacterized protein n=1 Tax=Lacihabitans soyangensis TaxID=869394 RepID=A0AAE3H6N9_9BACT|nr:hypothetical protein [Lacihabitans soyangensis]MCP9765140.1 hypothetical protein [Lacihabitans soyangensis]
MKVSNKINKRINKDTVRMFFELENDKAATPAGELLVEVRFGIFTKLNFKAQIKPLSSSQHGYVSFDVKRSVFAKGKRFTWLFVTSAPLSHQEGNGVLTDKWENLYEG